MSVNVKRERKHMYQGVKINYFANETGAYVEYRDIETDRVLRTANILDPADYDALTADEQQAIIEGLKFLEFTDPDNQYHCNVYFAESDGREVADFTKTESDGTKVYQIVEV